MIRRIVELEDLIHKVEGIGQFVIRPFETLTYVPDVRTAHNIGP